MLGAVASAVNVNAAAAVSPLSRTGFPCPQPAFMKQVVGNCAPGGDRLTDGFQVFHEFGLTATRCIRCRWIATQCGRRKEALVPILLSHTQCSARR